MQLLHIRVNPLGEYIGSLILYSWVYLIFLGIGLIILNAAKGDVVYKTIGLIMIFAPIVFAIIGLLGIITV